MGRIVGVGAVVERDDTGQLTGPGRNTVLRACDCQTGPVRDRVTPARRTSRREVCNGEHLGGVDMGDDAVGPVERSAGRATDTALASPEATDLDDNFDDEPHEDLTLHSYLTQVGRIDRLR